ncbi:MAG TPA: gamma-glutamylcyclotransferase family protein [bacterium]|nr:gamma-glutamylcyclotransferase family protein [bacterium]
MTVARLFVYGTLRNDTVVQGLLGHRLFGRPAVLRGYHREVDPAIGYPVILPRAGATVAGKVLDVDADALAILDAYEGARYRRIIVQVETLEGRLLDAYVYVPAALPARDPSAVPPPTGERSGSPPDGSAEAPR